MDQRETASVDRTIGLAAKEMADEAEAFGRLYHLFQPALRRLFVLGVGPDISADDFIQEVFARFWQQRKAFQGRSCLATYLFAIARHTLNEQRRRSRRTALEVMTPTYSVADSYSGLTGPETELYLQELAVAVARAKSKLTTRERHAMEISQGADIASGQTAGRSGCSRQALRSRLKRARRRLLGLLTPVLGEAQ
jgi:RNA polymerase sigma factor (sigma-70 family)